MQWTVGPEEPSVYWRRRAVVAGAAVVVLVVLIVAMTSGSSGASKSGTPAAKVAPASHSASPSSTANPFLTPTPSTSGSTSPSASPSGPTVQPGSACTTAQLTLVASTDKDLYKIGSHPVLKMTVRNASQISCKVDLGPSQRSMVIVSGTAHTWGSQDCAPETGTAQTVLAPGKQIAYTVSWNGTRSQAGCAGQRTAATAGTYRLTAKLGALTSAVHVFRLA